MMDIVERLPQWTEWSRRDDWHLLFVASDIREMLAEIERLRAKLREAEQKIAYAEAVIVKLSDQQRHDDGERGHD